MTALPARGSIAGRLTVLSGLVALLVFGAVGALLHWSLEQELLRTERIALRGKADVVQHFIDEVRTPADQRELAHHLDDALIGDGTLRVWIVAADGRVLYGATRAPALRPGAAGGLTIVREDGVALTGLRYALPASAVLPAVTVLIGVDNRERQALVRAQGRATLLVCLLGLLVTVGLAAWTTRRGLEPLRRLSDDAAAIGAASLSLRLSPRGDSRELVPLVVSFNHALDRVEQAYRQLEGFSADVAHELRTPLATVISGTEVALSRERPASELQALLVSHLEDLRALASMVNDMLFLANADRGERAANRVAVSLRDEALAVAEYLEASLDESRHAVRIDGDEIARVNAALLRRALVNLLSNAARHTAAGQTIVVRIDRANGAARVAVVNPGAPISQPVLDRMFDRFWRGDAARAKSTQGHGLGLAIVRAVALMHGGTTFASSTDGMTTVGFTLKDAAAQQ